MGAAVAMVMEEPMASEERIARLESDVSFIRADIAEIKADMRGLRGEVNSLKTDVYEFKTEVAKEFGRIRASIESLKLWMILTGIGSMASVAGLALTLARLLKYAT